MKRLCKICLIMVVLLPSSAMAFDHSYKLWNSDLMRYNDNGYVHYGAWQRNQQRLDQFIGEITAVSHRELKGWPDAEQEAFWINAFNALVIKRILDVYPKYYDVHDLHWTIAGQKLTVEQIRDNILRGTESSVFMLSTALGRKTSISSDRDLRVLFAICEGRVSSPPLAVKAYQAKGLPEQLEQQVRRTLSDPAFLDADTKRKTFHVGNFFRLYQRDFKGYKGNALLFERSTGSDRGVLRFIYAYLDQATQDAVLAKQNRPWRVDYRNAKHALNGGD